MSLVRMLEPRRVAVVGASERTGSFGRRMTIEALRSPAHPHVDLVNPRRADAFGRDCLPRLDAVDEPPDLVLLGVPDAALVEQLQLAASIGAAGAVVWPGGGDGVDGWGEGGGGGGKDMRWSAPAGLLL